MWVKIDDGMATHPKLLKAGPFALVIQIRAICYASQNKTDGFIPFAAIPLLTLGLEREGTSIDWCECMVQHNLWDEHAHGYVIHDFLEWNLSKKEQETYINNRSRAGKKGMKSRWKKKKSQVSDVITRDITPAKQVLITKPYHATSTSISNSSLNSSLNSSSEFDRFWEAYPKKKGKKAALQAWKKAKDRPALVDILQAIEKQKQSEDWVKENGQFIPHPSTWLNQGRWSDEPTEVNGMSDPHGTLAGMKAFLERGD